MTDVKDIPTVELITETLDEIEINGVKYSDLPDPDAEAIRAAKTGFEFIWGSGSKSVPLWGDEYVAHWQQGEGLMIVADSGLGKTTIALQLVEARLGISSGFLGLPIVPGSKRVLYIAADRPKQISRAFRRLFGETPLSREQALVLHEKLIVWEGPLLRNVLKDPTILWKMCRFYDADTLIIDSIKDIVPKLNGDEDGNAFNTAIQMIIQDGVQPIALHHNKKQQGESKGKTVRELADVYGSTFLTAGQGSVLALEGKGGDPILKVRTLKGVNAFEDFEIKTDFVTGRTERLESFDLVAWVKSMGTVSAAGLGSFLVGGGKPEARDIERARRMLESAEALEQLTVVSPGGRGKAAKTWSVPSVLSTMSFKSEADASFGW